MITPAHAKDKIIVPLDVPDEAAALRMIEKLGDAVTFYKVGLELFSRGGPDAVRQIKAAIKTAGGNRGRLFLDLKFHDIPNTVAGAVRSAAALEADMLTVHLSGGGAMLRAAAAQAPGGTLLLGVSVLTSIDEETLRETGVPDPVATQVRRLARLGYACGLRGVVASPHEIALLRAEFGDALTLVTPGVRPAWASSDDQRRLMTPGEAVRAGADYLVIGRPITANGEPRAAAQRVAEEMAQAAAA